MSIPIYMGGWESVGFILESHMPGSIEKRRKQVFRRATSSLCLTCHQPHNTIHTQEHILQNCQPQLLKFSGKKYAWSKILS